jgi:hypothetical protein
MTEFFCAKCNKEGKPLTIFATTLFCKDCLGDVQEELKHQIAGSEVLPSKPKEPKIDPKDREKDIYE